MDGGEGSNPSARSPKGLYRVGLVARRARSVPLLISSMPAATACSRVLNFGGPSTVRPNAGRMIHRQRPGWTSCTSKSTVRCFMNPPGCLQSRTFQVRFYFVIALSNIPKTGRKMATASIHQMGRSNRFSHFLKALNSRSVHFRFMPSNAKK